MSEVIQRQGHGKVSVNSHHSALRSSIQVLGGLLGYWLLGVGRLVVVVVVSSGRCLLERSYPLLHQRFFLSAVVGGPGRRQSVSCLTALLLGLLFLMGGGWNWHGCFGTGTISLGLLFLMWNLSGRLWRSIFLRCSRNWDVFFDWKTADLGLSFPFL